MADPQKLQRWIQREGRRVSFRGTIPTEAPLEFPAAPTTPTRIFPPVYTPSALPPVSEEMPQRQLPPPPEDIPSAEDTPSRFERAFGFVSEQFLMPRVITPAIQLGEAGVAMLGLIAPDFVEPEAAAKTRGELLTGFTPETPERFLNRAGVKEVGHFLEERIFPAGELWAEVGVSMADLVPYLGEAMGDREAAAKTRGELITGFTPETRERFADRPWWVQLVSLVTTDPFTAKAVFAKAGKAYHKAQQAKSLTSFPKVAEEAARLGPERAYLEPLQQPAAGRPGGPTRVFRPGAIPPADVPITPAARSLPRELAGAKPNYNIGMARYSPQFESDVDKALFIISQTKKSARDESYMGWLRGQLPDLSDTQLRAAGRDVRIHIKATLSGKLEGDVAIPTSSVVREALPPTARADVRGVGEELIPRTGVTSAADVPIKKEVVGDAVVPGQGATDTSLAQTGSPFRATLYRGSQRETLEEVYDPHYVRGPIFGEATYTSPSKSFASRFGPQVDELAVSLRNPLVISSDDEWLALTREAGLFSDVPTTTEEVTRLRQVIKDKGHDGVIIRVPESEQVGKRLQKTFSEDTVVSFEPPRPITAPVERELAISPSDQLLPNKEAIDVAIRQAGTDRGAANIVDELDRVAIPGEKRINTLMRRYSGALARFRNEANISVTEGNALLKAAGIGKARAGKWVPREEDLPRLDDLYKALHNQSKVASGEIVVEPSLRAIYTKLRELTDWEQLARIDFDPAMAQTEDYFYRGWWVPDNFTAVQPGAAPFATRPSFRRLRVDATYTEMRDAGFEPIYWNPFEQWRLSRTQGTLNREQMQVLATLKKISLAVPEERGVVYAGWRTPDIGPAFKGKVYAYTDSGGTAQIGHTGRIITPNKVADMLEAIYGKKTIEIKVLKSKLKPTLFGKTVEIDPDVMKVIDASVYGSKRFKLFGSFFQQRDFLGRSFGSAWHKFVDDAMAGRPIEGIKALAVWPKSAIEIVQANTGPGARLGLKKTLDSTAPLIEGRPGIHLRGIVEAGLSTMDPTIFKGALDEAVRVIIKDAGFIKNRAFRRQVLALESAMRRGLFEGTYPAAQITDIRNNIAQMVVRKHGHLSDEAINGIIAELTNLKYSTIPQYQSILNNWPLAKGVGEWLKRLIFSVGENEALLRQGVGVAAGPNKAFWAKHYLGYYLSAGVIANIIHFSATGKPLPLDRYTPISSTHFGPLPFGYNVEFLAPDIPFVGRSRNRLLLDTVGQMDTILRVLDPLSFLKARESAGLSALTTQITGRDFYTQPIDTIGPGGIISRTAQLLSDLFLPIGPGQSLLNITRATFPQTEKLIPAGQARIGIAGHIIEAPGLNVLALSTAALLDDAAIEKFGKNYDKLDQQQKLEVRTEEETKRELELRQEEQLLRGSPFAQYEANRKQIIDKQTERIDQAVARIGRDENGNLQGSRELRNAISSSRGVQATLLNALREEAEEKELFKGFETEPILPFDKALDAYYETLYDSVPPLYDVALDTYDFKRRKDLLDRWRREHPDEWQRVEEHVRDDERDVEKRLRQDNETLEAKGYWSVIEDLLGNPGFPTWVASKFPGAENLSDQFAAYQNKVTSADKQKYLFEHPMLVIILDVAAGKRKEMRDTDPIVSEITRFWGWRLLSGQELILDYQESLRGQ